MFLLHTMSCWNGNPYSKEDHSDERRGEFIAKCKAQDLSLAFEMTILSFRARPIGRRGISMSSRIRHRRCEGSLAFEHLDRDSSFHFVPFRMTSHREGCIAWLCHLERMCEISYKIAWQEMLRYCSAWHTLGGWDSSGFLPSEWHFCHLERKWEISKND